MAYIVMAYIVIACACNQHICGFSRAKVTTPSRSASRTRSTSGIWPIPRAMPCTHVYAHVFAHACMSLHMSMNLSIRHVSVPCLDRPCYMPTCLCTCPCICLCPVFVCAPTLISMHILIYLHTCTYRHVCRYVCRDVCRYVCRHVCRHV